MKNILLVFFFALSSFFGFSQAEYKRQELIIYMPSVDKEKTLADVINLVSGKDVHPVAFCDDFKCLLIEIDGTEFQKGVRVMENLRAAGYIIQLKSEATIQKVLKESKDVLTAKTGWH